jgi:hypothetical protein
VTAPGPIAAAALRVADSTAHRASPPRTARVRSPVPWLVAAACVPIVFTLARSFAAIRDIAYWDELDTALLLMVRLAPMDSLNQVLALIFEVGNEHRTVTSRLLYAVSYWLGGTVDFRLMGYIGVAFICGLCALLVHAAATPARRVRMFVLLAALLFQLQHYESFQWAGSSIDHFQIVLLAGASVWGLARGTAGGLALGTAAAVVANFTLAHGLVLWPVGALLLATRRRWRDCAIWSGAAVLAVAVFLYGFDVNPGHGIGFAGAGRITVYWLTLLGAPPALGSAALAPWFGAALLVLVAALAAGGAWQKEPVAAPLVGWAIGSLALVAFGRAELSQGHVYSRYYVLGALAWALVLFIALERHHDPARPHRALLRALPFLAAFNLAADFAFAHDARSWIICRDSAAERYVRFGRDGTGPFSLHPDSAHATRLLRQVERAGIYRMPESSVERRFKLVAPAASPAYFVDRILVDEHLVVIEGWAALADAKPVPGQVHLVLKSERSEFVFTALPVPRPDVARATGKDWRDAGFRFQRRRWMLPAEDFRIGFLFTTPSGAQSVMTAHRLDLTGPGVGILAK